VSKKYEDDGENGSSVYASIGRKGMCVFVGFAQNIKIRILVVGQGVAFGAGASGSPGERCGFVWQHFVVQESF
jgi:hypothetical protein